MFYNQKNGRKFGLQMAAVVTSVKHRLSHFALNYYKSITALFRHCFKHHYARDVAAVQTRKRRLKNTELKKSTYRPK